MEWVMVFIIAGSGSCPKNPVNFVVKVYCHDPLFCCNQEVGFLWSNKTPPFLKFMSQLGIAIINLVDKYQKVSQKKEKYFLLTYSLQRTLTKKYFQLMGVTKPTLKSNSKP